MTALKEDLAKPTGRNNILNAIEEILFRQNWSYDRVSEEELVVNVCGQIARYKLFFIWQEEMQALQFCCQYDMVILNQHRESAMQALAAVNENLWMGHFDIPVMTGTPTFRHACLMRGTGRGQSYDAIEDMIDIAMTQCERYYPVFHLLAGIKVPDDSLLSLALMETQGHS